MIIYTNAKLIQITDQSAVRDVWAVDIVRFPDASTIVKQTPSGMSINADDFEGDISNLREIDPVQFIDIGVDGRLSGERKELQRLNVKVRVPRTNVPEYEHLKLEGDTIKWYKEVGGQWSFHDASAPDIERFIQKYLTNAELITKQRIYHLGENIVNRVNAMENAQLVALLNMPQELPQKYNENYVIKKDGKSFFYANQNDVAQVDDGRIQVFGSLQSNITTDLVRIDSGIIKPSNSRTSDLQRGLYKVDRLNGPLIKLEHDDKYYYPREYGDVDVITFGEFVQHIMRPTKQGWYHDLGEGGLTVGDIYVFTGYTFAGDFFTSYEMHNPMGDTDGMPYFMRIGKLDGKTYKFNQIDFSDNYYNDPRMVNTLAFNNSITEVECPEATNAHNYDNLKEGKVYILDGDSLRPFSTEKPVTIDEGTTTLFTLCNLDLIDGKIYRFTSASECNLELYTNSSPTRIILGDPTNESCLSSLPEEVYLVRRGEDIELVTDEQPVIITEGVPQPYDCLEGLEDGRVYQITDSKLSPYESEGPVHVNSGIPTVYVCDKGDMDVMLPENVYVMVNGDDVIKVNREDPVTIRDGVPHPFTYPPAGTTNSGRHLLAAALMGAGVKEIISNSMIYEEHADDETELEA